MAQLTGDAVSAALTGLPEWAQEGDEIVRTVELESFPAAIAFVGRVAGLAEAANHHPDIDIRYRKVRIALTSHDAGGLTERDMNLAGQIDGVVEG